MSKPHAFATIRAARTLRERHPDAPPSAAHVALAMATYANGRTGTSIRPGVANLVEDTGLHPDTVQRAIQWLVRREELRRDKAGHRGSAACFTWVGGMGGPDTFGAKHGADAAKARATDPTHQPNQPHPSGPPAPPGGPPGGQSTTCAECGGPLGYLAPGEYAGEGAMCVPCFHGWPAE
jgi:hypothetical protein